MKRAIVALASVLVLAVSSAWAAEQSVDFKSGTETASGFLVTPEGKGPFPGVIVIQEWWGLDDWIKDQARALAREGYVALAPDLYRGKVTKDPTEAHQLMSGLPDDRAVRDLKAAYSFLAARADVKKDRMGVIGWCMGGKYALLLATQEPGLKAAVAYYGAPPTEPATIARIKAPILGSYGAEDTGISAADVKTFETALKKQGTLADIKIYPGAPHAFANPNNPWKGYRPEAARDAWARTTAFFAKYLKG